MRSFYKTRTQTADQTPFDNSTNGFDSITVQNAIEETLSDAINNDRYPIQASYNGNATSGRYLEIFPGESSDLAPLYMPSTSYIVAITIQANSNSTGAIEIYNITTNMVIYTASYAGTSTKAFTGLYVNGLFTGNLVAFRTAVSSINKPKVRAWFNTST
jgi:hypothetical protein